MSVNGSEASSEESVGTHGLSRHLSTPHLETFRIIRSASSVTPVNNYIQTPVPMSSFSTFTQSKSRPDLSLQDDPNPYSVSRIDEFRIQVQDPYKIRMKSTNQLNSPLPSQRNSSVHYYQELEEYEDESYVQDDGDHLSEKLANLPSFYKRTSSGKVQLLHNYIMYCFSFLENIIIALPPTLLNDLVFSARFAKTLIITFYQILTCTWHDGRLEPFQCQYKLSLLAFSNI